MEEKGSTKVDLINSPEDFFDFFKVFNDNETLKFKKKGVEFKPILVFRVRLNSNVKRTNEAYSKLTTKITPKSHHFQHIYVQNGVILV